MEEINPLGVKKGDIILAKHASIEWYFLVERVVVEEPSALLAILDPESSQQKNGAL